MRCLFVLLLAAGCASTEERPAYDFTDPSRYGQTVHIEGKLPQGSFLGQR